MISIQPSSAKHLWFIMLLLTIFSCVVIFYPALMSSSILYSSAEIDWPISSSQNCSDSTTGCVRFPNTISLQNSQRIENFIIASDVSEIERPTSHTRYFHPISVIRSSVLSILNQYGSKLNWLVASLKKLLNFCLFWKTKCTVKKSATTPPSKPRNDHVGIDINALSQLQRDVVLETYEYLRNNSTLRQLAEETNYSITHHLVYRYYAAADWAALYNGKNYSTAIAETILWRKQFDVCNIVVDHLNVDNNKRAFAYLSAGADKNGRIIIYMKAENSAPDMPPDDFLKTLVYIINKAEQRSVAGGSGEFVAIFDLAGLTRRNCPPLGVLRQAIALLGKHYPYRVAGIYVVNSGGTFQFLWNIIKPLISKKVIGKTMVMGKASPKRDAMLEEKLGLRFLEDNYRDNTQQMK